MSAVDVLAVMDAMYGQVWRDHGNQGGESIERLLDAGEQARAAVTELMKREAVQAELIADLRTQCVRNLELGAYGVAYWEDALESIDAALARVGGGK